MIMKIRRGSIRLTEQDLVKLVKKLKVTEKPKKERILEAKTK